MAGREITKLPDSAPPCVCVSAYFIADVVDQCVGVNTGGDADCDWVEFAHKGAETSDPQEA